MDVPLKDFNVRKKVIEESEKSLFVDAGAGSGKTTLIIDKIVYLIRNNLAGIEDIAAITFTRAAAAELRFRLREALTGALKNQDPEKSEYKYLIDALERMETAVISTIHSFCYHIITKFPLEAGIDPRVLYEQDESSLEKESLNKFKVFKENKYDKLVQNINLFYGDRNKGESVIEAMGRIIIQFPDCLPADLPELPPDPILVVLNILKEFTKAIPPLLKDCINPEKEEGTLKAYKDTLINFRRILKNFHNKREILDHFLYSSSTINSKMGNRNNWNPSGSLSQMKGLSLKIKAVRNTVFKYKALVIFQELKDFFSDFPPFHRETLRDMGRITNLEVLYSAYELLEKNPEITKIVAGQYRHIIIDEFQDTDPIQAKVAEKLARAGSILTLVGDPKQSIYRFRRSDIELYETFRKNLEVINLTVSFRSRPEIVNWINYTFGKLIKKPENGNYQPAYLPIFPYRKKIGTSPAIKVIPIKFKEDAKAYEREEIESLTVANLVKKIGEGWLQISEGKGLRPSQYGDIMILLKRIHYSELIEDNMISLDIPVVNENSREFYKTYESQSMITYLKALCYPEEKYLLAASMKGVLFNLSDEQAGIFALSTDNESTFDEGIGTFKFLFSKHRDLYGKLSLAELLNMIIDDTGVELIIGQEGGGKKILRNLKKLLQLAKNADKEGLALPLFVKKLENGIEIEEEELTILEDENSVKITTIYKAKGLERPVVILTDTEDSIKTDRNPLLLRGDEKTTMFLRLGKKEPAYLCAPEFERIEKQNLPKEEAEHYRLLYVACTRARDYLFIMGKDEKDNNKTKKNFLGQLNIGLPSFSEPSVYKIHDTEVEILNQKDFYTPIPDPVPTKYMVFKDVKKVRNNLALVRQSGKEIIINIGVKDWLGIHGIMNGHPKIHGFGPNYGMVVHSLIENTGEDFRVDSELLTLYATKYNLETHLFNTAYIHASKLAEIAMEKIKKSKNYFKEYPVMIKKGNYLIEGVIDLIYEKEDNTLGIIDFKTELPENNDEEKKIEIYYKPQIDLYQEALEEGGYKVSETKVLTVRKEDVE
ncbi:MAG: UvrD-helicase domain-containing protein [Thermodesulfobacteriota bacterium]|nr:UvrD-helicase domain-containing protein [Thermodesulfobacteriota bacterium]